MTKKETKDSTLAFQLTSTMDFGLKIELHFSVLPRQLWSKTEETQFRGSVDKSVYLLMSVVH